MINLTQPIQAKYTAAILAGPPTIHQDTALLALRLALADLDEIWQGEHAALLQRHEKYAAEILALRSTVESLQAGINQVMLENDALEAEHNRLRTLYEDTLRNYEISRLLADEARTVRSRICDYLLPHITTPHGFIALAHLPDDYKAHGMRLLHDDGDPIDDPATAPTLIELAHYMFEHLKQQNAELYGQCTALEAECNRLRASTTASSQPISATTAISAPAASNTSNPPAPTPPSPAASPTASAATAAPASSATTSPPKPARPSKTKNPLPSAESAAAGNPLTAPSAAEPAAAPRNPLPSAESAAAGNPLTAQEAGQNTTLDPTSLPSPHLHRARTLLADIDDINHRIWLLNQGKNRWRNYSQPVRLAILVHLWQEQWTRLSEFDRTRPAWMPTGGAVAFLTTHNRWSEIQQSINELRQPPSATNS